MKSRVRKFHSFMAAKEHPHKDITPDVFYKNRFTKVSFVMVASLSILSINTFSLYLYFEKILSIFWVINAINILTVIIFSAGLYFVPYHIRHYGLHKEKMGRNVLIGLCVGLALFVPACWYRSVMLHNGYDIYRISITAGSIVNLLLLYPLSAFIQELVVKGYLQTALVSIFGKKKSGKFAAIILSSLVFCQLHIHYNMYMPHIILFAFLFSVVTGYIFEKTRSVIGITVIHYLCGAAMTAFLTL